MNEFYMGMMELEQIEHQVELASGSEAKAAEEAEKQVEIIEKAEKSEEAKIADEQEKIRK